MRSTIEMIKRHAIESSTGEYLFTVDDNNELLYRFRYGVGDNYESENCGVFYDPENYTGVPTVEIWITTRKKLEDIEEFKTGVCPIIRAIKDYDTIDNDEREEWANNVEAKTGTRLYDYHLSYIPAAYVADFFPALYPHKLSNAKLDDGVVGIGDDGSTATFKRGSLAEFAISHGCDYMDMRTGVTYRGI